LLQAVGQVVQPIFNRGALIANLKISKNAYDEAALAFQQTVLEAGSEVNNALTQWQASRQRLDLTAKQVAALETAYKSTQLLMQHSSTTYLEVLTAQQTLLQAQLGHSAEKYNEIQAVITLYNALGGGRN
jgi:outer membrane protein TolC